MMLQLRTLLGCYSPDCRETVLPPLLPATVAAAAAAAAAVDAALAHSWGMHLSWPAAKACGHRCCYWFAAPRHHPPRVVTRGRRLLRGMALLGYMSRLRGSSTHSSGPNLRTPAHSLHGSSQQTVTCAGQVLTTDGCCQRPTCSSSLLCLCRSLCCLRRAAGPAAQPLAEVSEGGQGREALASQQRGPALPAARLPSLSVCLVLL
jgi:hypothetical protein